MAIYTLELVSINEPVVTIKITDEAEVSEYVRVGNLPLKGTSEAFVAAAKTYVTNMLTARASEEAEKQSRAASAAVKALVGKSANITI